MTHSSPDTCARPPDDILDELAEAAFNCTEAEEHAAAARFYYDDDGGRCVPTAVPSAECTSSLDGPGTALMFATYAGCAHACQPIILHQVSFDTAIVDEDAGLSFLVVTFTSVGDFENGRSQLFSRSKCAGCAAHAVPGAVAVRVTVQGAADANLAQLDVSASRGFTPWVGFNNTLSSGDAVNDHPPRFVAPVANLMLAESDAVSGQILFRLGAVDDDPVPAWLPMSFGLEGNATLEYFALNGTDRVQLTQ